MSEQPELIKLKRITIKTESGSRWFDDPHKLQAWCREQRELYSFFRSTPTNYQSHDVFYNFDRSWAHLEQVISANLIPHIQHPDVYESQAISWQNSFQQFLSTKALFTEDVSFTDFIKRQRANGDAEAMAAFCAVWGSRFSYFDASTLKAFLAGLAYLEGREGRKDDELNGFEELKLRWDAEFTEQRDHWLTEYNAKFAEADQYNQAAADLHQKLVMQTETQTEDFSHQVSEFKQLLDQTLVTARQDLENLTKTYDEDLALRASVRYWGLQQKDHRAKSIGFGIALGVIAALVMIAIIAFSFTFLDASIQAIHVSRLVTATVLTTFGIWLVRVLANLFMSHMHLATDAQERRTMIHTYLALLRKGHGPKDDERQLILQTLCRPSSTDMVKNDHGPAQIVDLLNRMSPKGTGG